MNKAILVTSVIVAIIVIGLVIGLFLYPKIANSNKVEIPNIVGKEEEEAIKVLEKKGLSISDENKEEYSEKVEAGSVIRMSPSSGRTVKKGTIITLTISKGSEDMEIKDYKNQKFESVKKELEKKGILVSETYTDYNKDDGIEDGTIIDQDLEIGETFKKGDTIKFTVARIVVTYPDFAAEEYTGEKVQSFCDENGLKCTITEKINDNEKVGIVYYQSQTVGKKVVNGASLTVYVAKATEKIEVPNVKGETLSSAKTILKNKGFVVSDTINYEESAVYQNGYVISTNPAIGSKQVAGTTISLTISKTNKTTDKDNKEIIEES